MITQLYRHFDKDDNLLYVGISLNVVNRLSQHKNGSSWFDEISRIKIEVFNTREKALQAETEAIKNEKPKYNKISTFTLRNIRHPIRHSIKEKHIDLESEEIKPLTSKFLESLIDDRFKLLMKKEPKLIGLKDDIIELMTTKPGNWYYRNELWYHQFKPIFSHLLGFMAKKPELKDTEAYDVGYETFIRLLQLGDYRGPIVDLVELVESVEFNRSQPEKLNSS